MPVDSGEKGSGSIHGVKDLRKDSVEYLEIKEEEQYDMQNAIAIYAKHTRILQYLHYTIYK